MYNCNKKRDGFNAQMTKIRELVHKSDAIVTYFIEDVERFKDELSKTHEKRDEVSKGGIVHFVASAYVGVVEWWLTNGMPYPPRVMADQVGTLCEAIYNLG